ncbi:MAG: hypothetical protein IPN77_15420 [Sandaracinaceae bacterium]|nr:hypothetical protein [Sandaracinaceae bacterium]
MLKAGVTLSHAEVVKQGGRRRARDHRPRRGVQDAVVVQRPPEDALGQDPARHQKKIAEGPACARARHHRGPGSGEIRAGCLALSTARVAAARQSDMIQLLPVEISYSYISPRDSPGIGGRVGGAQPHGAVPDVVAVAQRAAWPALLTAARRAAGHLP